MDTSLSPHEGQINCVPMSDENGRYSDVEKKKMHGLARTEGR